MKKKAAKANKAVKRSAPSRPTDVNQIAHLLVEQSTREAEPTESETSRVMAALGRKGGRIGGRRRADSMTPERRREIALKAARARWDHHPET